MRGPSSAFWLKTRLNSFNEVADTCERKGEKRPLCVCSVLKLEKWWIPVSSFPNVMIAIVHSTALHSLQE